MFLSPDEILEIARQGAALGCLEALFTLGDRPEDRWPEARQWLDERGYDSTLAYVRAMAIRVLEETGLLPHLNPGVMSWEEINRLKPVSPSMGMMLETTSRRLFETKGEAHSARPTRTRGAAAGARGRRPALDPVHLRAPGRHRRDADRAGRDDLRAARHLRARYGAVQEVIVQNFRAKPDTAMRHADDLGLDDYRATIAVTRLVLGPKARVQAPPNLVDLAECRALLGRGRRRLGRGLAAHPRPRQPRAPLARPGAAARRSPPSAASSCRPG